MSVFKLNEFAPDYAIHPGEILGETLEARGIKKVEFARRCRLSPKTISLILSGKAPVSAENALRFERVLGVAANVWNNLESNYRLHIAKISARKSFGRATSWAKKFPISVLVKNGFIKKPHNMVDTVENLLSFFAVGSVNAWRDKYEEMQINYRSSSVYRSSFESLALWLRIGEIKAEEINTAPFNKVKFLSALKDIRMLTFKRPDEFEQQMVRLCGESGVALVFVSDLPKTYLCGAARWLNKDKALIILSLRYKSNDHFWFSFFHEAVHIIKHGKKQIFIDEIDMKLTEEEKEADQIAANMLIPEVEYNDFINNKTFFKRDILNFSKKLRIAPGIVVGRLQHDKHIPYTWHNDLKRRFILIE